MLILNALNMITRGVIAYYAARKYNCYSPISSETERNLDNCLPTDTLSELSNPTPDSRREADPRCEMIFNRIAFILKEPSEDLVYSLESLFSQLRFHYPYEGYIKDMYNSCEVNSNEDIEDFAIRIITKDFDTFLSKHKKWEADKNSIVDLFNELLPLLKKSLRGNTYLDLLASYFKDNGKQKDYAIEFLNKIWECYEDIILDANNKKTVQYNGVEYVRHDIEPNIRNYQSLLGMAGRTYSKLISLYQKEGIFEEQGFLSNELIYDIAGTIIQYTDFYFCRGLSTSRLAKDILDSIIDYLHNGLAMKKGKMSDKDYVDALFNRYIGNRNIHSYYYFLKMCTKICHSISIQQPNYRPEEENLCIPDSMRRHIIDNIMKYDFPFIGHISPEKVYAELEDAYNNRKWDLPPKRP